MLVSSMHAFLICPFCNQGFYITLDFTLDAAIGAPIIPQLGKENKPKFDDLSQLAIEDFNSQNVSNCLIN